MLVVRFSIGCSEEYSSKVLNVLNNIGVSVSKEGRYNEKVLSNEREPVIYYECLAPYTRMESIIERLDNGGYGTVILAY